MRSLDLGTLRGAACGDLPRNHQELGHVVGDIVTRIAPRGHAVIEFFQNCVPGEGLLHLCSKLRECPAECVDGLLPHPVAYGLIGYVRQCWCASGVSRERSGPLYGAGRRGGGTRRGSAARCCAFVWRAVTIRAAACVARITERAHVAQD